MKKLMSIVMVTLMSSVMAETVAVGSRIGDYQVVDYIESSGRETINLGVCPSEDMVAEIEFTEHSDFAIQNNVLFGAAYCANGFMAMFTGNNLRFHSRNDYKDVGQSDSTWRLGERTKMVCTTSGFTVNGAEYPLSGTVPDMQDNIFLFYLGNRGGAYYGIYRLHHFKLTNGSGTIMDLYPVRDTATGVAGMWDVVNEQFYGNQESGGAFTTELDIEKTALDPSLYALGDSSCLYAFWDSIANSEGGVHDPNAKVWKDLAGDSDLTMSNAGEGGIPIWTTAGYFSSSGWTKYMTMAPGGTFWSSLGATWTIQAFFTPTGSSWLEPWHGVCGYHGTSEYGAYLGQSEGDGKIASAVYNGSSKVASVALDTSDVVINQPVLLTFTGSPNGFKLYVNDELYGEDTTPNVSQCSAPGFLIGTCWATPGQGNIFDGIIHSVRVYSKNLTGSEIALVNRIDRARYCGEPYVAAMEVSEVGICDGTIRATIGRESELAMIESAVTAYWGAEAGGETAADWDGSTIMVGRFMAGEIEATVTLPEIPSGAQYLRLEAGGVWSEVLAISELAEIQAKDTLPGILRVSQVACSVDSVTFEIIPAAFGDGVSSVAVSAIIDGAEVDCGTMTDGGGFTVVLDDFAAGSGHDFSFVLDNGTASTTYPTEGAIVAFTKSEAIVFGDYTLLDYIQSDGSQFIDTGVMPSDGLVTGIELTPHDASRIYNHTIFGAKYGADGYLAMFVQGAYGNGLRYHTGGVYTDIDQGDATWKVGERLRFVGRTDGFYLNEVFYPLQGGGNSGYNVCIFHPGDHNGSEYGVFRLHYMKMTASDGSVLREFYPVRTADDEVGLYDLANDGFYRSSGGNAFIAGGECTSESIYRASVLPTVFYSALESVTESSAAFTVVISSFGDGFSRAGIFADCTHNGGTERRTIAEDWNLLGQNTFTVSGLDEDTQYDIDFVIKTDAGETAVPFKVTTMAGEVVKSASFDDGAFTMNLGTGSAHFGGALKTIGGGEEATVYLYVGETADDLHAVDSKVITAGDPLDFGFDYAFPAVEKSYTYAFCVSNDYAGSVCMRTSDSAMVYVPDTFVYRWDMSVHEGAWEDSGNWIVDGNPVQATYPHSKTATAIFAGDETAYEISVNGYYHFRMMYFDTVNQTISFNGTGYGDPIEIGKPETWRRERAESATCGFAFEDAWQSINVHPWEEGLDITFSDMCVSAKGLIWSDDMSVTLSSAYLVNSDSSWITGDNSVLRLVNGSIYNQIGNNISSIADNLRIIIDDSILVSQNGWSVLELGYYSTYKNLTQSVEFYGTHPYIEMAKGVVWPSLAGETGNTTKFIFHVPENGYERAPVNCLNSVFAAYPDYTHECHEAVQLEIAKDSPAYRAGRKLATTLVTSAYGFDGDAVVWDPAGRAAFSYNGESAAASSELNVLLPNSGMIIIIK